MEFQSRSNFSKHITLPAGGGDIFDIKCLIKPLGFPDFPSPIAGVDLTPLAAALQFYRENRIDAFIITDIPNSKDMIKDLKLHGVERIAYVAPIYWLDPRKLFVPYLETNLIDACNLNCKACTHFANLFKREEVYPLNEFAHDIESISKSIDVRKFRLLGGEPFLLKNLDEYLEIARKFFPQTTINLVSNGLLIYTVAPKIFDSMRRNSINLDISEYPPTIKRKSQIIERLNSEGIRFSFTGEIRMFNKVISDDRSIKDPFIARKFCVNDICRFLRHGKIYKCPIDALKFRFAEEFQLNYPPAMGVDIHAANFTQMLEMLDGNIDQCYFCTNKNSMTPWQSTSNPTAEDWLA